MREVARLMRAALIAGVAGFAAQACATADTTSPQAPSASIAPPADPAVESQTLKERAAAFWAARIAGDPKGQWELLEPRGRGRVTPQEYSPPGGPVHYVAYQVEDAIINGYFAVVKVRILFQPVLPGPRRLPVQAVLGEDRWVRVQGVWYRNLDQDQQPVSQ